MLIILGVFFLVQTLVIDSVVDSTFKTINLHLLFFFQVVFILIVTIVKAIIGLVSKKEKVEDSEIVNVLSNEQSHKIFKEFCQAEFSPENIACYDDIQKYKKMESGEKAAFVKFFFNLYLNGSKSDLEVNVNRKVCVNVQVEMEKGNYPSNLLDEIESGIIINLSDTYSRLIKYPPFQSFRVMEKELKNLN